MVWGLLLALISPLRRLIALLLALLAGDEGQEPRRERGCFTPPPQIRARPDPYLYSQPWLDQRGLAYTWDNPDFTLVDPESGVAVPSHGLEPGKRYLVEVTIHNASLMPAFGTEVSLEVHDFGIATSAPVQLGTDTIDVPAAGSAIARAEWLTPATGGHNCLLATISHHDDANPMNNVGQHNTDVAVPASPERALAFGITLPEIQRDEELVITVDGYELPENATCAGSFEERRTHAYRERVQREHHPARYPVAKFLAPRLVFDDETFLFEPPPRQRTARSRRPVKSLGEGRVTTRLVHGGGQAKASLVLDPPPSGAGQQVVNLNVYNSERLLGGVTAIVEEV